MAKKTSLWRRVLRFLGLARKPGRPKGSKTKK
jgi:hypothetical protein